MAGLRIDRLKKAFGHTVVCDGISFDVKDGEFCILLGPSGCGKSTILRMIAGLERQDSGSIFVDGREVSPLSPKERDVAMVFQSYALYPHMNVYENMTFSLRMRKTPREYTDEKVMETARLLEIEDLLDRKPKELSGGQRQRVAIGRAIVRSPKLFLFDEPLSNLDAKLRTAMRVELAGLHRKLGSTIVYVTHDQTEAMTLGQRIILLDQGSIQQTGSPKEIYDHPSNLFVATFVGSPQINLIEGTLTDVKGKLYFQCPDFNLDVSHVAGLDGYRGQDITLGLRPESLSPGEGPVSATIEFIERLGSETILYTRAGSTGLAVRVLSETGKNTGETISFTLSDRGMHFFYEGERVA
jgi:ABC-type sugar transport system ATPase subunit